MINFAYELTSDVLDSVLSYNDTKGDPYSRRFGYLVHHFFNYQTA
jgi:hypothetical protein